MKTRRKGYGAKSGAKILRHNFILIFLILKYIDGISKRIVIKIDYNIFRKNREITGEDL